MPIPRRFFALAACLLAFASAPARSQDDTSKALEAKVALESSLEKRVQSVLSQVLGTPDVVVIISVDVLPQEERLPPVEGGEVLPGVPVKETQSPSAIRQTLTMVRKISATVVVDNASTDDEVAAVKKVASDLLGLDPSRGDVLSIEKMALRKPIKEAPAKPFDYKELLKPPLVFTPLWMLLILLGLAVVLTQFLRPFVNVSGDLPNAVRALAQALKETRAEEGPAAGPTPGAPIPGTPAGAAFGNGNGHKENRHRDALPFAFVRDSNLPRLMYLLKKDTPENVAVVVHYLAPEHASRVLGGLDLKTRSQVAARLGSVAEMEPGRVKMLEERIKTKIDFIIGGEDRLLEILDRSDEATQEAVLAELGHKDKNAAEKLRGRIVRFANIEGLDARELQALVKRAGTPLLAAVLKPEPQLWTALKPKLPEGLRQRLAEEIELSRELPEEAVAGERRRVVELMKQLEREGWIRLHKAEEAWGAEAS